MNENDLMSRLVASKAIMDNPKFTKSRNSINDGLPPTSLQDFDIPNAKYNIPQEFLQESSSMSQPYLSELPKVNTKPVGVPSVDAIKSSKLPDEIKRLMIEHPIEQPTSMTGGATLSNELVEKAARLMGTDARGNQIVQPKQKLQEQTQPTNGFNMKELKSMLREVVEEVLQGNGILSESEQKSNEVFSFKVGKHIFEGKVTKIKKIS
jgi:hypothetical protein